MRCTVCLALGLLLLGRWGSVCAEVQVIEQDRRYVLDASTLVELADQLARVGAPPSDDGAARSHGLTEAGIETRYELDLFDADACGLRELQVRVQLVRILPEWKPARPPEPEVIDSVNRMLKGLAEHEEGHRRHVLASAAALDAHLAALPAAPDCTQARRTVDRIVSRALIRLQMREMNYDLATDKGRKQGAFLQLEPQAPKRRLRQGDLRACETCRGAPGTR